MPRPREDNEEVEFEVIGPPGAPAFVNKVIGRLHNLYLVGEIKDPSYYVQWFELIRNAKENDIIYIHINSPGGNAFTALQMIRCMNECRGQLVASVEGMCLSAATLIFLNATRIEVSNHSLFMFHNYSGAAIGKGGEIFDQASAEKKWSSSLFREFYKDFLTDVEIDDILSSKDLWLDTEEVIIRLRQRAAKQKADTETQQATVAGVKPVVEAVALVEKPKRKRKKNV